MGLLRAPLSYIPIAPALAGTLIGILSAPLLPPVAVLTVTASAIAAAILLYRSHRRLMARAVFFVALGLLSVTTSAYTPGNCSGLEGENHNLHALVIENEQTQQGAQITLLQPQSTGKILLYIRGYCSVAPGDSIIIDSVLLRHPAPVRWPHQFDYRQYLENRGITLVGNVTAEQIVTVSQSLSVVYRLKRLRGKMVDALMSSNLSDNASRFLAAALLGDSSKLSHDDRSRYSAAGIAHLLALSGTHAGVIALIISVMLFPLYLLRMRRALIVVTLIALWGYAVMTGLHDSVVRAVTMATILGAGYLLSKLSSPFNSLFTAAVIILLVNPGSIYSISFQLSFTAVASILFVNMVCIKPWRSTCHPNMLSVYIVSIILVSVAATIATAPITVSRFGIIPVYFLLANVPAMIIITPLLASGMILVALEVVGCHCQWICRLTDILYSCLESIVNFITSLPCHVINDIHLPWQLTAAWIAATVSLALWIWMPRKSTTKVCASICLCLLAISFVFVGEDKSDAGRGEELFIINNSRYSGILYRHANKAWLITPEKGQIASTLRKRANRAHRNYLRYHGIDSLVICSNTLSVGKLDFKDNSLSLGGETIRFITSDNDTVIPGTNTILLCRGTTKKIIPKIRAARPDTIVLMPSINRRVAKTVTDSLSSTTPIQNHTTTILHRILYCGN